MTRKSIGMTSDLARWFIPAFIIAITLVVFLPVLNNDFVNWDDDKNILENPYYRGLGWTNLKWMFTTRLSGHYQPLSWITLGLDYLLWGMEPFGYHLTNLLLHTANAVLFYFVALRLLRVAFSSPAPSGEFSLRFAAAFAALAFSIHPLRVESVAWITERRDVLSGLFFLLAILCYLQAAAVEEAHPKRWRTVSVIIYAFSLLSKSIGMTLPIVLLILDIYPLKRLSGVKGNWFGPEARRIWLEKVPFLLLALLAGIITLFGHRRAVVALEQYAVLPRLTRGLVGLAFYIWKTVLPLNLSPIYEVSFDVDFWAWRFLLSAMAVLGITIFLLTVRRRWPAGLAAWVCYGVMLTPVLGVIQTSVRLADRYSYLSCLGWAVLGGSGFLYRWHSGRSSRTSILLTNGLAVAILVSLGLLTWKQTQIWKNSETLWKHALSIVPQSKVAQVNLGYALTEAGNSNTAMRHFRRALEIDPDLAEAYSGIGHALSKRGELKEASDYFRRAVEIKPFDPKAHYNLAFTLGKNGDLEGAIHHFQRALELRPDNLQARYNLAIAFTVRGDLEAAIAQFHQVLAIEPNNTNAHYSLGVALTSRGRLDEAIDHFRRALRMEPEHAKAREWLARAHALQDNRDEALKSHQKSSSTLK